MSAADLGVCYQLIAELLLHPDERDATRVEALRAKLGDALTDASGPISEFLDHPLAVSAEEYVQTLELSPPCPLYLGAYLFEEPASCRGAGTSGRNAYMLELAGVYRHFGLELSGRELPDYVPALAEFLAISLDHSDRDQTGLRRWLLERYVLPALEPLRERLARYQSPYALLARSLAAVVCEDLRRVDDRPAWRPAGSATPAAAPRAGVRGRRLPVAQDGFREAVVPAPGPDAPDGLALTRTVK